MNFWDKLKSNLNRPITSLAPMEDVTDTVFRRVVKKCGRPDVFFTEFTNCDGVQSVGQAKVIERLKYKNKEKPIVAQIWGAKPENYYETAKLVAELGFDGVDINMGCPVKNVVKSGACSALIKNPQLAKEIIEATRRGVNGKIPVSVKTRLGFNKVQLEDWIGFLLKDCKVEYLTVHGRTVSELTKVPCHFDELAKVVELKNKINKNALIFGNGDIVSYQQGIKIAKETGLDGFMIGRGIFQNPWIFNKDIPVMAHCNAPDVTVKERIKLLKYHVKLFKKEWKSKKDVVVLKKFFKMYINGFPNASELRSKLMAVKNYKELDWAIKNLEKEIKKLGS